MACPYVEKGACQGEACVSRLPAPIVLMAAMDLTATPGGSAVTYRGQAGEFMAMVTVDNYVVPCRGEVTAPNDAAIAPGTEVFRLGLQGEGAYRLLVGTHSAQSDTGEPDNISYDARCPGLSEQWVELQAGDGSRGWVPADHEKLDGLSYYSSFGPDFDGVSLPDWLANMIPPFSFVMAVRKDVGICGLTGRPLRDDEIRHHFAGARFPINSLTGNSMGDSADRVYTSLDAQGNWTGIYVHDGAKGATPASLRVKDNRMCIEGDGLRSSCYEISICLESNLDAHLPSYFLGIRDDGDVQEFFGLTQNARTKIERARPGPQPASRRILYSRDMLGMSPEDFAQCGLEPDPASCWRSAGVPEALASGYANLMVNTDWGGALLEFVELGVADYARIDDPNRNRIARWEGTVNYSGTNSGQFGDNDLSLRYSNYELPIHQQWPAATLRYAGAPVIYTSYNEDVGGDITLSVRQAYAVINGCTACPVVGQMITETKHYGWHVNTEVADVENFGREVSQADIMDSKARNYFADLNRPALEQLQSSPILLQRLLSRYGFYHHAIDGAIGALTRTALRDFQHEHCLPITGVLDAQTANAVVHARDLWGGCAGDAVPGLDGPFYSTSPLSAEISGMNVAATADETPDVTENTVPAPEEPTDASEDVVTIGGTVVRGNVIDLATLNFETDRAIAVMLGADQKRLANALKQRSTGDVFEDQRRANERFDRVLGYADEFRKLREKYGPPAILVKGLKLAVSQPKLNAGAIYVEVGRRIEVSNQDMCGLPSVVRIVSPVQSLSSTRSHFIFSYPSGDWVNVYSSANLFASGCEGSTNQEIGLTPEGDLVKLASNDYMRYHFADMNLGEALFRKMERDGAKADVICYLNQISTRDSSDPMICQVGGVAIWDENDVLIYMKEWAYDITKSEWAWREVWGEIDPTVH
ncbi:MAG: peptidoglycan-binding domain-containing protein [Paracoccus sp. (in: a-proteobacteria)]|nr:peptidoglycan-binding domain-containing protein [Paracoccus sp. (in: a-proteobacteria)]